MRTGSSDPRPSADIEGTPPRLSEGDDVSGTALPSPGWVETPRLQGQEGAPKPPQSGCVGVPITISDGSVGDPLSKDARTTDKEAEDSIFGKRTPWPIGLHSVEERRKKEEERSEGGEEGEKEEQSHLRGRLLQEAQVQQLQPEQQQHLQEEQPQLRRGERLEEQLEQYR